MAAATNNMLKSISALQYKKYRQRDGLFVVEGRKMVKELLRSDYAVGNIFVTDSWLADNKDFFDEENLPTNGIINVSDKDMQRISSLATPDGILATVKMKDNSSADFSKPDIDLDNQLIVALDNISNPGNLGTIIRIAAWFGIKQIICNSDTVDCYNPKVLQSTMGAIFHTDVTYTDLQTFLAGHKSTNIYGTVLKNGKNIYKEDISCSGIVIIGNESHGISGDIAAYVNCPLTIPCFAKDEDVESLNASVACGIILSEFRRR